VKYPHPHTPSKIARMTEILPLGNAVELNPYSTPLPTGVPQVLSVPFPRCANYNLSDLRLVLKVVRVLDDFDTARSRAKVLCHRLTDPVHLHGVRGAVNVEATRA
jgi:hypothetical protein